MVVRTWVSREYREITGPSGLGATSTVTRTLIPEPADPGCLKVESLFTIAAHILVLAHTGQLHLKA
jgi:hypothetical protein